MIVAAAIVAIGVMFSFVIFAVLAVLVLVLVAVIAVRIWWLRRQLRSRYKDREKQAADNSDAIEGEYEVKGRSHRD